MTMRKRSRRITAELEDGATGTREEFNELSPFKDVTNAFTGLKLPIQHHA
jgi:hypothetical protein